MEFWLGTSPWYGVILWMILYTSDYYLTIYSARGFREIGHFQFEGGPELTPKFQKDVETLKPVSKLHVTFLILLSILILLLWGLTERLSYYFPWTYLFFLGMFLLLEVAVHLRHLRNISLILEIRKNGGVEGQIFYRKWFSYRISAAEFCTLSGLFLIVGMLNSSPFFVGGALTCFATGIRHGSLAKQAKLAAQAAIPDGNSRSYSRK